MSPVQVLGASAANPDVRLRSENSLRACERPTRARKSPVSLDDRGEADIYPAGILQSRLC